mmetsp:Transcript_82736/g.234692  ORF Transcript_82736/g.234692 Transcript_82736/m.234692 type:complete len:279 (+) Transcript_82736:87-923(+)
MAPKGVSMVYKTKGRGKGKAKAKGKGKAKAKARGVKKPVPVEEPDVDAGEGAAAEGGDLGAGGGVVSLVVPKPKAKASAVRKKVFEEIGETSLEDAIAERKAILQSGQAEADEAAALEAAQQNQVNEAQADYQKAQAAVEAAIEDEAKFTGAFRDLKAKKAEAAAKVDTERRALLEAQKKHAMLEVLAVNHKRMQELEARQREAKESAEAAKQNLATQRQREKDALEATRRALEETRQMQKAAAGRGAKRGGGAPEAASPGKRQAVDGVQDTVPADID